MVELAPPEVDQGNKACAGVDVAILADADEEETVENVLRSLIESVAFKDIGAEIVLKDTGGEVVASFVKEVEEVVV